MSVPLRVLHLGSPTELYGAERWILALVKHLDPETVKSWVGVIKAPEHDAPLIKEALRLGISTIAFESPGKVSFSAIPQLRYFIRGKKIDIVHTHFYKTDVLGLIATRGLNCKIISTPHGWSQENDFKLRCYELLDRAIFPYMDAVVPLSEDLYKPLARIPFLREKLYFIQNGVDISEIDAVTEIAPEIIEWKKQGFFVAGYIGQLISRKNLETLLKAMSRLSNVKWKLAFIGEGKQRSAIEQLAASLEIKEHVRFFGFRKDRIPLLKGFDVFILPSLLEGVPRCLMEAMAARVPVIASDIPGCRDLIVPQESGLLFPPGDFQSLAECLRRLRDSTDLTQNIVKTARKLIERRFSAQRMAEEYTFLYEQVKKIGSLTC
ncbi:glycosyltransferase, partial [bacterium]|nr:glycosyltransferase [bacterium]